MLPCYVWFSNQFVSHVLSWLVCLCLRFPWCSCFPWTWSSWGFSPRATSSRNWRRIPEQRRDVEPIWVALKHADIYYQLFLIRPFVINRFEMVGVYVFIPSEAPMRLGCSSIAIAYACKVATELVVPLSKIHFDSGSAWCKVPSLVLYDSTSHIQYQDTLYRSF